MSRRLTLVVLLALAIASACFAQDDARLAPLMEKFDATMLDDSPVFMRMYENVTVNGEDQGEKIQEIWALDLEHFRMERSDGTLLVFTPEEVTLLFGPANVGLHIPTETLEELGDDRTDALRKAGIGEPTMLIDLIDECRERLTIVSEDEIGEDCWVLAIDETDHEAWTGMLKGVPDDLTLTSVQVALGKDTGMFRGMYMELDGPITLTVRITCPDIDPDTEIPEDTLTMELPEDATVIVWTAERTAEEIKAEFEGAIKTAMEAAAAAQ